MPGKKELPDNGTNQLIDEVKQRAQDSSRNLPNSQRAVEITPIAGPLECRAWEH